MLFVDANNLYGHAMSQPLPTRNFQYLSPKEIEEFYIAKTVDRYWIHSRSGSKLSSTSS